MTMVLKGISKKKFLLILLLLCVFQFFAVFRVGGFIYRTDLINITCIMFSAAVILIYRFKPVMNRIYTGRYFFWIMATIGLWILEIANSLIRYSKLGQGIFSVLSDSFGILSVIMFFPLCYIQRWDGNPDNLKNLIKRMSCVAALLSIAQAFLYNYGIVFLDLDTSDSLMRNGRIRFGIAAGIVSLGMIISFFDWIAEKNIGDLFSFIVEVFYSVYATQTRSRLMCIIAAIYFTLVLFNEKRNKRIFFLILGIFACVMLIVSGIGIDFALSLSTDDGILMRFNTISFYMKQWLSSPIIGMGYIKASSASSTLLDILMGPLYYGRIRYYYRSDVGVIGLLNESGILGLIWYIWIIVMLYKSIRVIFKTDKKRYIWAVATYIYILLCSVNLIYITTANIAAFTVYIALIRHYEYEIKNRTQ